MKKHLRFLTLALLAFTANSVFAANEVGYKFSITKANGTKFAVEVLTVCEFKEDGTTVAKNGTVKLYRFTQSEDAPATSISLASFKVSFGTYDIVEIGDNVFMNQTDITKITSAGALEKIGESAFEGCTNLETFSEGNACTKLATIGDYAFRGCEKLYQLGDVTDKVKFATSAGLGENTLSIGKEAFKDCTSIVSLTNNTNISVIGESAFEGCTSLVEIYSQFAKCKNIPASAFAGCPLTEVNVSAAGYATYTAKSSLDFTNAAVKAYKIAVDGENLTLTKMNKVTRGDAVLLYAEGGKVESIPVWGGNWKKHDTGLVAVTEDIEALASEDENGTNYILNNGESGIGFYKANGQKVAAGKAYLNVPVTAAKSFMAMNMSEAVTGINNAISEKAADGKMYNLNGQRVSNNYKGVVVVNGKKVLVK